jgi:diacylglycerol kinase family enzyme
MLWWSVFGLVLCVSLVVLLFLFRGRKKGLLLQQVKNYKPPQHSAVAGKSFLCLVNPNSGNGESKWNYERVVQPMLMKSGAASVTATLTAHSDHFYQLGAEMADRILQNSSSPLPDAVIFFGGDGSMCEYVNGMVAKATNGSCDLTDERAKTVLSRIAFGIIPSGSSNGIAASYGVRTPFEAISKIIHGKGNGDNISLVQANQITFYDDSQTQVQSRIVDLHFFSWGMVTEHDALAEGSLRYLGVGLKLVLAPTYCILRGRTHQGSVRFRPAQYGVREKELGYNDPQKVDAWQEKEGWKQIEGEFLIVTVGVMPWAAYDICIVPDLGLNDGVMCLMVVRGNLTRFQVRMRLMYREMEEVYKYFFFWWKDFLKLGRGKMK